MAARPIVDRFRPRARDGGSGQRRRIPDPPRRILLASMGTPITQEMLRRTIELATPEHAKITVLGIAKVYGTSLGLPHPALQPTAGEWEAQREIVNAAAKALRQRGFEVRVGMTRSRNAAKMISKWVVSRNFHAVVMADPDRPDWRRLIEGIAWSEVHRRTHVPVHPVRVPATSRRGARAT